MPQDPYVLESYCPGKINNTYNNNGLIVYRFRTLFVVTIQLSMLNRIETFEKCSILFKFKEGENFNHRNTLSILRIKI